MKTIVTVSLILAATPSVKNASADEMVAANSAVAGASGTKHMRPAEPSLECNEMIAGEMAMMNSCLMPFGIMTGEAGKWMVGYQFMHEKMDGSLVGTDDISVSQILKQFPNAPTDMTMDMHMWMVMYAPTDRLTLSAMIPYVRKEMNNVSVDGSSFVMRANGVGDLELRPAYLILQTADKRHQLLLNGGIGVPTGSIDEEMDGFRVDYCMQPGSGTVSLLPGLTYLGQTTAWSWGADFKATVRLGRNDHNYRFGNRYESRAWVTRQLTSWLAISTGINGAIWEDIEGADPELDPMMAQTTDPNLQGGKRLDASFGLTFCPMPCCHGDAPCCSTALTKFLNGQQLFVEGRLPIIQSLDGPQLQNSWSINIGWQWMF
jgi:Putative MetA-pathway of phenol degradation